MLFVTYYQWVGERGKEHGAELMTRYAERGVPPGQLAHYIHADNSGGFVIGDESGLDRLYGDALAYSTYLQLETRPILTIDEAMPQIMEYLQS